MINYDQDKKHIYYSLKSQFEDSLLGSIVTLCFLVIVILLLSFSQMSTFTVQLNTQRLPETPKQLKTENYCVQRMHNIKKRRRQRANELNVC